MNKFTVLKSKTAPLPISDVDTDMIVPAQFLTSTSREGYGENLFRRLRDSDPDFVLNQKKYAGAEILCANNNFGCGSSREHAVWAVLGGGFRAVIAKSFADIFFNNSAKNGLLLVVLPPAAVDKILREAKSGDYELTVDLEAQEVVLPGGEREHFDYDPFRKHCLLHGLDDIDYIKSHRADIEQFRRKQDDKRFFTTL